MTDPIITVMVVDDQRPTRMGLTLMIHKAEDLRVIAQAAHGRDALDQLAGMAARGERLPDVVLMDIRMPVLNGIDATAVLTRRYPAIRTLVLTTYDQDDYAFGALGAGASGFLLKDTRSAELHQAIRAVAAGDAILTPRITRQMLNQHMTRRAVTPEQRDARQRLGALSPREREVAGLVAQGLTNAEIAGRLFIQPDSVKKSVTRILGKLGLRDRVQLVIILRDAPDALSAPPDTSGRAGHVRPPPDARRRTIPAAAPSLPRAATWRRCPRTAAGPRPTAAAVRLRPAPAPRLRPPARRRPAPAARRPWP